jgi:large subunit ribosomal protein L31
MKEGLHPKNFRTVIFKDISCDKAWLGKSCAPSKENADWEDGNSYPLVKIEISNESHPFYTGKMKFVDTAGRIDKFKKKYQK